MKEYCFVPNLDDERKLSVRILEGDYKDSVITLEDVIFEQEKNGEVYTRTLYVFEVAKFKGKLVTQIDKKKFLEDTGQGIIDDIVGTMLRHFPSNKE